MLVRLDTLSQVFTFRIKLEFFQSMIADRSLFSIMNVYYVGTVNECLPTKLPFAIHTTHHNPDDEIHRHKKLNVAGRI